MRKLMFTGLLFLTLKAFSQTDSVTISKEKPDTVDVKYDRIYKLFIEENNQEIRHLIKVNLLGLFWNAPTINYEYKLGNSFTCETSLNFTLHKEYNLSWENIYKRDFVKGSPDWISGYHFYCYEMIKYYYNLNHRQKIGKNTNGFSGNYLAVRGQMFYFSDNKFYYAGGISYGLQRRIGNIGYFEPSALIIIAPDRLGGIFVEPFISIKMGFAVDSFSNLKRMLKK